ncbi:MAG: YkgJ family cysteine cluster protein [Candidatus Sericytochromatia bacterium]
MKMDQTLENIIVSFAPLINESTNVGLSNNIKDLYFLMDLLVQKVKEEYQEIPCKNKCSMCCESFGLPRTTTIEWQIIFKYLNKNYPKENLKIVIDRTLKDHVPQLDQLMKEQARIQEPHTKRIKSQAPRPDFKCGYCPFLIEGSCSIYPVRPAICRAYGYFSIRVEGQSQLFTCRPAADKMMSLLRENGVENWVLPVWDKFAEKVFELNKDKPVATLPIWLLIHLDENNELKNEIIKEPDFDKFYENFISISSKNSVNHSQLE